MHVDEKEDGQLKAALRGENLAQLVAAVKGMHQAGYVHRDIRPKNIGYCKKDNQLYLMDAGFAVHVSSQAVWEGGVRFASPRILGELKKSPYIRHDEFDDMHQIIRSAYAMIHPHLMGELQAMRMNEFDGIADFWQTHLSSGSWLKMNQFIEAELAAAKNSKDRNIEAKYAPADDVYDKLKEFLCQLV